jgi:hypothetical protein
MRALWTFAALALAALGLALAPAARADEPKPDKPDKPEPKSFEVPYRLTAVKHIMIRAKINGKGPFNFILDTGAPALFVTPEVCEKAGVEKGKDGWGAFDKFEIEGGVVVEKAKGRVEKPFQLEGMNGLGLGGAELHGMIGYNILARYRMEIDFTKDKMVWTELDWKPKAPMGLGGAGGVGGLEVMGPIMKLLGGLIGAKAEPDYALRGFLGVELADEEGGENPLVKAVLENGPAAKAGVKVGDKIAKVQGRTVVNVEDVERFALKVEPGQDVKLTLLRGKDKEKVEIAFKAGEGF